MIPTNEKIMMSEGMLLLTSMEKKKKTSIYSLNDKTPEVFESPKNDKSGDHQLQIQENIIKQECWRKALQKVVSILKYVAIG